MFSTNVGSVATGNFVSKAIATTATTIFIVDFDDTTSPYYVAPTVFGDNIGRFEIILSTSGILGNSAASGTVTIGTRAYDSTTSTFSSSVSLTLPQSSFAR